MANNKKIHEGHSIKRFREMLIIKQETLAFDLGEDWTQKKYRYWNQKKQLIRLYYSKCLLCLKYP